MTTHKAGLPFLSAGALLAVAGAVTTVIYLFQPWRTCDYDDTPSACAMLPADAAVLMVAVLTTMVGVFLAIGGAVIVARRSA